MGPMADEFLAKLISSPLRAKVLRVFVFGQTQAFTLKQAAKRAGSSPRYMQKEINALEDLRVLKKAKLMITLANGTSRPVTGKQKEKAWTLNLDFKHSLALSKFVHEISPIHHNTVVAGLRRGGRIATVILSGAFVGDGTRPADLIVAGDYINERKLEQAVRSLEREFGREIRYAAFSTPEFRYRMTIQDRLIRDTLDYPHLVLLDKTRLL